MRQSAIGFQSKRASLDGVLSTPGELPPPYPAVVVCHAHPTLGGNMDSPLITAICRAADARGFATLRFNFRGVGSSEGEFTNGDREHEDVKAALDIMKRWPDVDGKRLALVAYSFSAGVALKGLKQTRAAKSLVLIAPPISSLQGSRANREAVYSGAKRQEIAHGRVAARPGRDWGPGELCRDTGCRPRSNRPRRPGGRQGS